MILEYCYLFITKDNKSRHQNQRVNGTIKNANVAGSWGEGVGGGGTCIPLLQPVGGSLHKVLATLAAIPVAYETLKDYTLTSHCLKMKFTKIS